MNCADCKGPIGQDNGPKDGWQLEDGRTVCQACAAKDLKRIAQVMTAMKRGPMTVAEHVVMLAHTQWLKTEGKP